MDACTLFSVFPHSIYTPVAVAIGRERSAERLPRAEALARESICGPSATQLSEKELLGTATTSFLIASFHSYS